MCLVAFPPQAGCSHSTRRFNCPLLKQIGLPPRVCLCLAFWALFVLAVLHHLDSSSIARSFCKSRFDFCFNIIAPSRPATGWCSLLSPASFFSPSTELISLFLVLFSAELRGCDFCELLWAGELPPCLASSVLLSCYDCAGTPLGLTATTGTVRDIAHEDSRRAPSLAGSWPRCSKLQSTC